MPPRKEPCRNFLRGSCHYGDRCKFLHVTQQQPKPNVFGFGSQSGTQFQRTNFQQQQQPPNPFGFGVQNSSQSRGANDVGLKQNQHKPFENKWIRSSANASNTSARQPDNQQAAANHVCTDPESCKRQIIEDFQNEKPLWNLTCYGHRKNGPCDVIGDVSYEELRVAAYDDAKRGLNLQSIVERERGLITSKLAEFDNLVRNSYSASANSAFGSGFQSPLFGASQNVTTSAQSPPLTSSFSQLGAFLNTGLSATPSNTLQQSNPFENFSQVSGTFGVNNVPFGNAGSLGSQFGAQSFHSPFTSSSATLNNAMAGERNSSSVSLFPQLSGSVGQSFGNTGLIKQKEKAILDDSIWSKEWKIGEIPEEAPPDEYIF
nr:zinc finger CCCH domain-containing protein 16 [Ipomoea batatas]